LTRKIGRYEILGPLATGGMAEILLARLVGPSGFERPVVIKRIRRDLDHHELAAMFIDEARLAAKVRHANVVAVEDLGTDDGAPYLVMEYLEGENVSNVERRLKSRDERTPFGLTAYIVAEACAGLHAAHELRDPSGEPMGLVHRDVSPQNVFVTYGGAVKVVDFGIARTTDSAGIDPSAAIQGKYAYMAPEQIKKEAIDRRTDVFALGVVLYELLTGHTLFRRFSAAATMRAVLSDPIVAARRVEPSVPPSLEAICARALSRSPDDRYANAAEMRRELLVAMRDLVSEEPSAELAELMVRSFPDRIEEKQVLVSRVREGSVVDRIPVGDVDVTVSLPGIEALGDWSGVGEELETITTIRADSLLPRLPEAPPFLPPPESPLPTVELAPRSAPSGAASLRSVTSEVAPRAKRRRARLLAAGAGLLLLAGGGAAARVAQSRRASDTPPATAARPASTPVVDAPPATVDPSPRTVTTSDLPPAPTPPAASSASAPAASRGGRKGRPRGAPGPSSPSMSPDDAPAPSPSGSGRGFRRFQ
jgi:serine/threonine-protein kinase